MNNLEYLELMKKEDKKVGMSGSYLQRQTKANEIIAEILIRIYDRMCSEEGMNVNTEVSK